MIKSMTGFGRGSAGRSKNKINVEIRTVNSRFFEFKVRGIILEPTIERTVKEYIGSSLERGNVHLLIEYGNLKNNQSMIFNNCLLYTSPSPRDATLSRMPSSA